MKPITALLALIMLQISCGKASFDYDDYETRVEYFQNINTGAFLEDSTLTLITWNIKLGFGHDKNPWSEDIGGNSEIIDSIAQLLKSFDPDIVLLQEVPYNRENTIIKEVLDSIGHRMDYNFAFGGHGFNSNGTYPTRAQWGNAILSKFEISSIENREVFNLNDKWSRRSVLKATLKYRQDENLDAFSLHFSTDARSDEEFRTQVHKTYSFHQESENPIILGGDFNYSSSIDTILKLVNCSPPDYGDIDRIYISDNLDIITYYSRIEHSLNFSDHFAGIVEVKIND
jgi:endonuclease/exonuclease/phosphatase family metal-dependent hydrolase